MQFPPKDENTQKEILEFIQSVPFNGGQWSELKKLYKQLEINSIPELLVAVLYRLDKVEKNDLVDEFPTWKTVTYLKRRAARHLRKVASENEELYIRICKDLMLLQKDEINLEWQWIMKQILFGDSKRFEQKRNGRGKVIQKIDVPNIVRSEEKFSDIWNKYPAILELIMNEKGLAEEVYEFAVKVLLRNGREIPSLHGAQFNQFFISDSPFLQYVVAEQGFEKLRLGIPLSNNLKAKIFLFSDEKRRQFILENIQQPSIKPNKPQSIFGKMMSAFSQKEITQNTDLKEFVNELTNVTFSFFEKKTHLSNRVKNTLDFLFKKTNLIESKTILRNANSIFLTQKTEWENVFLDAMPKQPTHSFFPWLTALKNITPTQKNRIFAHLAQVYSGYSTSKLEKEIRFQLVYAQKFLITDFGWYLAIKNEGIGPRVMNQVLWNVSWQGTKNLAFKHLIQSEYAAKILVGQMKSQLPRTIFGHKNLLYVLNHGHDLLKKEGLEVLKINAQRNFFGELLTIARLPKLRDDLVAEIEPNINPQKYISNSLFQCLNSKNKWIYENTWRIIGSKPPKKEVLQQILLFTLYQNNDAKMEEFINRISAIQNPEFKQNFTLALKNIFQTNPYAVNRLANLFGLVVQVIDIESVVNMLKAVNDQNWDRIKSSVQTIAEGENGVRFWLKLLEMIAEDENDSVLANRFLEDENLSQTFFKIKSPDVLECHHPAFEDILEKWLQSNENLFEPNSPELFQAATHRLPKIRNWALEKAQTLGMDVPFAMQLMESGLPETVKIGKQFFENAEAGTTDELENLLALCDSPNSEVRAFGMSFFQSRKENFDHAVALECLSEHTDPIIQEFVAERLAKKNSGGDLKSSPEKESPKFTRKFDKAVLRTKNRGRKAKELVKNRIEKDLNVSVQTLLELARGHNKKDKEWALEQLTKLALKGEEMPDFQLIG